MSRKEQQSQTILYLITVRVGALTVEIFFPEALHDSIEKKKLLSMALTNYERALRMGYILVC